MTNFGIRVLDRGERSSLRGPRPDEDRLVRLVDVAVQLREVSARAARGLQLGGDVQRGMAGEAAPTPLRLRPPRPLLVRPAKVAEPLDHTVLSALRSLWIWIVKRRCIAKQ